MSSALRWNVVAGADGTALKLSGPIDEMFDFDTLFEKLPRGRVVKIDLGEVHRISSVGVRLWICFLEKLKLHEMPVVLEACSVCIVRQLNMISQFRGHGTIRSVHAPYYCVRCNKEQLRLIDLDGDVPDQLRKPMSCPTCGAEIGLDEEEALYTEMPR